MTFGFGNLNNHIEQSVNDLDRQLILDLKKQVQRLNEEVDSLQSQRAGSFGAAQRYRDEIKRLTKNNKLGHLQLERIAGTIENIKVRLKSMEVTGHQENILQQVFAYIKFMGF